MLANMCHFPVWPFFNFNFIACSERHIYRGQWCSNIEWYIMIFSHYRYLIRSYFVSCITICCYLKKEILNIVYKNYRNI